MRAVPWRLAFLLLISGFLFLAAWLPDPATQQLSNWSNAELIEALSSERSALQREAVRQLVARARTVVPQLTTALQDAERARRNGILEVFEELLLSADPETSEAAEIQLEELTAGSNHELAESAGLVLYSNSTLRHARAVARYLELGGQFARRRAEVQAPPSASPALDSPGRRHEWLLENSESQVNFGPRILLLNGEWQGGDAGLRFITRIFPGETIVVHIADESQVTAEGIREMRRLRRNLFIRRQGEACLGVVVSGWDAAEGVHVADVIPDSPAARGGIEPSDLLIRFDGFRIRSFGDLRRYSAMRRPGERVAVQLRRQGQMLRMKIELGSDFGTETCQCQADREASSATGSIITTSGVLTPIADQPFADQPLRNERSTTE